MYDVQQILREPLLAEPLRRAVEGDQPPAFLRSAKLKITARCNLRCKMCRYGRGEVLPELGTERLLAILGELAELGCRKVHFSGGEVLVRKDFEELAARAAALQMKVTLTSNLTLLNKERAKRLMRSPIRSISTSLDGATRKTHERIRRIDGSFDRTLRALRYLSRERERRGRKLRIRVNFTMMRENFRDYPALLELAAAHGVSDVLPMPVDTKDPELRLSKRLVAEYEESIAPEVRRIRERLGMPMAERYVHPFGEHISAQREAASGDYAGGFYRRHLCFAPWTHVFIAWDGKVFLCCMTNGRIEPLGDLSSDSVRGVFHGERFAAIRRTMKEARLPSCHQCDMFLEDNRALASLVEPPVADAGAAPSSSPTRGKRSLAVLSG